MGDRGPGGPGGQDQPSSSAVTLGPFCLPLSWSECVTVSNDTWSWLECVTVSEDTWSWSECVSVMIRGPGWSV